jgi:5-methylcytosine-specific restriction endonuclease McrA
MQASTLVLDIGYQPHRVIPWQRAVALIFDQKAEVVDSYDEELMTPAQASRAQANGWTLVLKVPAVVRLLQRVARKKAVRFSRMNVLTRDNWTCCYCGRKLPTNKLNYDHVVPRSQGGRTVWENIVTSCLACNSRKENRTPQQAGMRLLRPPVKPKSLPVVALHFEAGSSVPDVWRSWCYWNVELEHD